MKIKESRLKIIKIFSLVSGGITGLLGIVGVLGLCSASFIVGLFALLGLNSMILMIYNKIFLLLAIIFFGLAFLAYFRGRKNGCDLGETEKRKPSKIVVKLEKVRHLSLMGGLILVGLLIVSNSLKLAAANKELRKRIATLEGEMQSFKAGGAVSSGSDSYLKFKQIKASIIPSGIPEIYGKELNISFDEAQKAIDIVSPFDPTYGSQKIVLAGKDLERYKKIGSLIACEYCCGAKTLVFENGEAACGCDHSQMMRGLAAWLIKNQPAMKDEQILGELKKWKAVFFPKETLTTKIAELEKQGEPGIKGLLQEFPDFLPSMVGGC